MMTTDTLEQAAPETTAPAAPATELLTDDQKVEIASWAVAPGAEES